MANRFARKTGNWNASDVWSDTPSGTASVSFIPGVGDVAMSNSFTVTVNVDATCSEIRNDATGGATASGSFTLSNGITLTANVYNYNATVLTYSGAAPNAAYLVGSVNGEIGGTAVSHTSTGTLYITGNVNAGSGAVGITSATSYLNVTGNVTGGSGTNTCGIQYDGSSICTINGNVTGGSGGINANGIRHRYAAGTLTVNGNVTGGTWSTASGIWNIESGPLNISGNVTGGTGVNAFGINTPGGPTTVVGHIISNNYPNDGITNTTPAINVTGSGTIKIGGFKTGTGGLIPITGTLQYIRLFFATGGVQSAFLYDDNQGNLVSLSNVDADHPAISDVRSGVSYYQGNRTGTCAIPPAAAVGVGVPVDNTVGQAALTQADIAAVLGPIWSAG